MEKDFIHTEPVIFCQACGAKNSSFEPLCRVCKAPLFFYSLSEKEEKLFEDINEDLFIVDEIRALKDTLSEVKNGLLLLADEIKNIKKDILSIFNGFSSLKEILEEREILKAMEVQERWQEKEALSINIEDQVSHFLKKKENVLSKYKGKNFSSFAELLEKALKILKGKNVKGSLEVLKKALKKDSKNIELCNLIAFINLKNRNFREAGLYLNKSLKLEENPEAFFLKAWLLSSQEKFKTALELVEKVKGSFPDTFLINLMEGNLNFSLKNYSKAAMAFSKALEYEDSPYVRFLLFKSFFNLNKKGECLPHLEKLKNEEFYREEALFHLGKTNYLLNKRKTALQYFEELLEEFPKKLKYELNYLIIREKFNYKPLKPFKEEIEEINKKIEKEDFDPATSIFSKLYKINKNEPFIFLSFMLFNLKKERNDGNLKNLEIFLKGKNYEIYRILTFLILMEISKNQHQHRQILNFSFYFYNHSNSYLGKAISAIYLSRKVYEIEKETEKALKIAKEALILLPEDLKIYGIENIASLIFEMEKKEEVYEILKEVSESLKEESIYLNLAKQALKLGRGKDAKEIFRNMRKYHGKPYGLAFYFWKELFNEIRSYLV